MFADSDSPIAGGCPASALVMAARAARTPLAIADARSPDAPIMFANAAFAELLGRDAASLAGRPLTSLAAASTPAPGFAPDASTRIDAERADGSSFPAAMSTALVRDSDGAVMCWLCSLIDARGEDADNAIARDAAALRAVAKAASDLMHEAAMAADAREPGDAAIDASDIALRAAARAIHGPRETNR